MREIGILKWFSTWNLVFYVQIGILKQNRTRERVSTWNRRLNRCFMRDFLLSKRILREIGGLKWVSTGVDGSFSAISCFLPAISCFLQLELGILPAISGIRNSTVQIRNCYSVKSSILSFNQQFTSIKWRRTSWSSESTRTSSVLPMNLLLMPLCQALWTSDTKSGASWA